MKKNLLSLLFLFMTFFKLSAQTTYYWVAGNGAASANVSSAKDWVAASWNTAADGTGSSRSASAGNDILIFDGNSPLLTTGNKNIYIRNVPRDSCGQLQLINGAFVNIQSTVAVDAGAGTFALGASYGGCVLPVTGTGANFNSFFRPGDYIMTGANYLTMAEVLNVSTDNDMTIASDYVTAPTAGAFSRAISLYIKGNPGLQVDATSTLGLGNTLASSGFLNFVINLLPGATGTIYGNVSFQSRGTGARIVASDPGALAFKSGSNCNIAISANKVYLLGSAQGTGSAASSTFLFKSQLPPINFEAGANYRHTNVQANSPFGVGINAATPLVFTPAVAFLPRSNFYYAYSNSYPPYFYSCNATGYSPASAASYGNVIFNGTSIPAKTASASLFFLPARVDTLTISNTYLGTTAYSNYVNNTVAPPAYVYGTIINNSAAPLNFGKVMFMGSGATLGAGATAPILTNLLVGDGATLTLNGNVTVNGTGSSTVSVAVTPSGKLDLGNYTINGSGVSSYNAMGTYAASYNRASASGSVSGGCSVTSGSNTVQVRSITNIPIGSVVTSTSHPTLFPAGTVVLSYVNGGNYFVSRAATASVDSTSSPALSLTFTSAGSTTATSNSSGLDGSLPSFTSVNSYSGANYIFSAATSTPFSSSTPSPINVGGITINANTTLNKASALLSGNLSLNAGVFTIPSSSAITVSGNVINNSSIVFKSDATGTARFGAFPGTFTGTGNATVERYIPNNGFRSWRMLSVPTYGTQTINAAWQEGNTPLGNNTPGYGTQITGTTTALGFDDVSTYPGMLTFNGTNFVGIPRTSIPISSNKAYFLYMRGDRTVGVNSSTTANTSTTLRTTGSLYYGTQTSDLIPADSYALIGNPFASAIDFNAVTRTGGVNNTFYIWDSKLQSGSSLGAYQTFSSTNGFACPINNGSFTFGSPNTVIQSGQAFFVETSGTSGTLSIPEASKVATTGSTGYKLTSELVKLDTRLYSINPTDTSMADANVVVFDSTYSNAVDSADASKFSNAGENLAILRNQETLVIEGRSPLIIADTIFFKIWNMKPQAYQLEFVPQNLGAQNLSASLEDSYLNTSTPVDMSANTLVNFTVNSSPASYASSRFRIVFAPSVVLPVSFQSISASRKASNVQVNWKLGIETNVNRYEVERSTDGSKFNMVGNVTAKGASAYLFSDISAPSINLFYRIRSIGSAGEVKYSSVVKVGVESSKPSFAVVPNPVEGAVVNIQFVNQPKGLYQLRLVNAMGQQVITTSVSHPGGFGTQTISLPSAAAIGTYQLEIIAPDRSSSFEKIFVNNTL